jgi:hypothetical protein
MAEAFLYGHIDVLPLSNEQASDVIAFSPAVVEVRV